MKAVILARVSSKEQGETSSLDSQVTRLREYCIRSGFIVVNEYKLIESSTKGKRKKFYDVIEKIKSYPNCVALVADAIDRVQRDFKETILLNELVNSGKIEIHFRREGLIINNRSSGGTHIVWDAVVMAAKMYIVNLKESSRRGKAYARERGIYPSSAMPFGYISKRDSKGKRIIAITDKKAQKIARLFKVYVQGNTSLGGLADIAVSSRLLKKPLNKSQEKELRKRIRSIITNPFYMGEMDYNGSRYPHIYKTVIDKETFHKCQRIRTRKGRKIGYSKYNHNQTMLHNLAICGCCGGRVVHILNKSYRPNPKRYYECCTARWSQRLKCSEMSIKSEVAREQIASELYKLKEIIPSKEQIQTLAPEITRGTSHRLQTLYVETSQKITQIDITKQNLIRTYLEGLVSKSEYLRLRNELDLEKNELEKKRHHYGKFRLSIAGKLLSVIVFAANAHLLFEKAENEYEQRKILFMVFEKIVLKNRKLNFIYRPPLHLLSTQRESDCWKEVMKLMYAEYPEQIAFFNTEPDQVTNYDITYKLG